MLSKTGNEIYFSSFRITNQLRNTMKLSYCDDSQITTLVVTNLPKGKVFFSQAGQSYSKEGLLAFTRRCRNCPPYIEAVSAESVGLEWHSRRGKEPWGDEYRKGKWVILHNVDVMARPDGGPNP